MIEHDNSRSLSRGEWLVIAAVVLVALGLKLWLVGHLPLFGDEAFYWWESRHLAWGYSALPPLTPWTILASTGIAGDSYAGVRWMFLLLGSALPLLLFLVARELVGRREAALAALASLALPLVAIQGLIAMPDVLLNCLALGLLLAVLRALDSGGTTWWLAAGVAAALGLMTHFRFLVPLAAIALGVVSSRAGRAALLRPAPWAALIVAGLGLLPTLWFNWRHGWVSLAFQFADRHPWTFQAEGLLQPLVQALVATPGVFALLAVAAWIAVGLARRDWRWRLIASAGILPLAVYFIVGLFADQERTTFHWPLVGFLPLCVLLPAAAARAGRILGRLAFGLAAVTIVAGLGGLAWLESHPQQRIGTGMLFPDNALGWGQVAGMAGNPGPQAIVVADNFMLAAQLAFELDRKRVHVLDHPLNHKHGRAAQLSIWGYDEGAIPAGAEGVLVVEETALGLDRRPAWSQHVCDLFPDSRLTGELTLFDGRKRFRRFDLRGGRCDHPAFSYVDEPVRGASVPRRFSVSGWAFDDDLGIESVTVLIDGTAAARAEYGLPRPGVSGFFPQSSDPSHPDVGFLAEVSAAPGAHLLSLRIRSLDGNTRDTRPVEIEVGD